MTQPEEDDANFLDEEVCVECGGEDGVALCSDYELRCWRCERIWRLELKPWDI